MGFTPLLDKPSRAADNAPNATRSGDTVDGHYGTTGPRPVGEQASHNSVALLMHIQRSQGNRFVQRLASESNNKNAETNALDIKLELFDSITRNEDLISDQPTLDMMDSLSSHNLGDRQIHRDEKASFTAQDAGDEAFTTSRNLYFAPGLYAPKMREDRQLPAKEPAPAGQSTQQFSKNVAISGVAANSSLNGVNRVASRVATGAQPDTVSGLAHFKRVPDDPLKRPPDADTAFAVKSKSTKVLVPDPSKNTHDLTKTTPSAVVHSPNAHESEHGGGHVATTGGKPVTANGGGAPVADLDAWKASLAARTNEIQDPQLNVSAAAPGNLDQHAQSVAQQRMSERPNYSKDARDRMPTVPQEPPRENILDTQPADAAIASLKAVGAAKLPDQTFPAILPLPLFAGAPAVGGGAVPASVVPPALAADAKSAEPGTGSNVPADTKAEGVKAKVAAVAPTEVGAGPGQAVNLQDKGAASLAPLPPAQAIEIGDVVARVLQDAGKYAKEIVDAASAQLDPSKKAPALTQLTDPLVAKQQDELTTELNGVATAAGVSTAQLAAKVEKQKEEAAAKTEKAATDLDAKSAQAKTGVQMRGTKETSAIGGAASAVKDEIDRKQQAAKGEPDAAAIDAKRDSYLKTISIIAARDLARYRASAEARAADLERVGNEQKAAYKQRSRAEAERIKALFPDDPVKGKIESRPVLDWGDRQALEVDGAVARLTREANAASMRLREPLNAAAMTVSDQIRDWAATKKGVQRSWWERLFDMFKDWGSKAKAENNAWEAQRNAETRDKVAGDFDMLVRLRDELAANNQEAFKAEMSRLTKEQLAIVMTFIKSGGKDSIGAVAIGLIERIKAHCVPEFAKALEKQAIAELGWKDLNQLGGEQSPGFDAGLIVRDVRGSVKGWGTDEKRLFKALQGRTPIQIAAMRKAYADTYPGRDMDEDIDDDLSGSEADRAKAYLSGDPVAGAVASLHDAMAGIGTDEALIMETLRGKSPVERQAITAAYKEKYGVELKADLEDEMSGNDLDQANALVEGDTTKADAIAINEAMDGIGTDEKGINAVYTRIRDEVEADAKRKGMTTAEVNAEIQRRTGALKRAYGAKYAGGDPNRMEADFRDELSGGELNLVLAEQVNDQTVMDAAKIQIEHESLYTDDDKVNAVLIAQHDRAEKEVMRDLEVDFNEKAAHMKPEERTKAREQMKEQAKTLINERAKQNMAALQNRYDAENPQFGFQAVIDFEVQGYSHDEALERIKAGGKLDAAHELKYSIFGLGTNEDRIKETLKGKSRAEIDKIKADYKSLTGNDLLDDLKGDLGGRDLADATFMLEGTSTPEEKLAYLKKRGDWEVNQGTGLLGEAFDNVEEDVLVRTNASAQAAYDNYWQLKQKYGEGDPRTQAALEEFERWSGYSDKDIEEHRASLDSITDTIAAGVAIVAGIAVTVLTAGAAGPAVLAAAAAFGTSTTVVAAAAGAIVATAASMLTKELMKGGAYDAEAIATDMAQGTVEALVAVATAGVGEAALKALLKSPAFAVLAEAAESGTLGKLAVKGVESGFEGAVQGLPSGMAGAILNENTWKSDNPFGVIMEAGAHGSLQGAGMGAVMGAGMEAFGPKVHAGGSQSKSEGVPEGVIKEQAGLLSDSAAKASDRMSAPDRAVGADEGAHGTGAGHEATHSGATGEPEPTSGREQQAPRATKEPHGPSSERTIVDDVHDLMFEETVMQGPNPKDPADARLMYENSIAESPNREVGIYRNSETGEYIVIQGNEGTVSVGSGEAPHEGGKQQRWKEILDGADVGRWELQAHSHPVDAATGVVDPVNQWPSGANGDMGTMAGEAQASGEARSSRIDYKTADGPNYTDFGFDPAHEKPYWVDMPDGVGGHRTERFKTMEGYHDYLENTVGAPSQGDIPDHLSGTNPTLTAAEPVAPLAAKDAPASATEVLDAFEKLVAAPDVESAFTVAGKAATKAEKATSFEPGEAPPESLTVTDQMNRRLRTNRASTDLEAAMAANGDPRPPGHDTHHIVADADPRASVAREILLGAGINPRNAPENGIHLPRTTMDPATIPDAETRHQTIHTDAYYKELTLWLIEAKSNGTVPETLAQIKAEIAEGKFMNASKQGATRGETFAAWLLEHSTHFDWMTPEEITAVVEGVTRQPRSLDPTYTPTPPRSAALPNEAQPSVAHMDLTGEGEGVHATRSLAAEGRLGDHPQAFALLDSEVKTAADNPFLQRPTGEFIDDMQLLVRRRDHARALGEPRSEAQVLEQARRLIIAEGLVKPSRSGKADWTTKPLHNAALEQSLPASARDLFNDAIKAAKASKARLETNASAQDPAKIDPHTEAAVRADFGGRVHFQEWPAFKERYFANNPGQNAADPYVLRRAFDLWTQGKYIGPEGFERSLLSDMVRPDPGFEHRFGIEPAAREDLMLKGDQKMKLKDGSEVSVEKAISLRSEAVKNRNTSIKELSITQDPQTRMQLEAKIQGSKTEINNLSEALGVAAGREFVARQFPDAKILEIPRDGSGVPDLLVELADGRLMVIECKGGEARLGARRSADNRNLVEQGHRAYLESLAKVMAKSEDGVIQDLGRRLQLDLAQEHIDGERRDPLYYLVRQPFDESGHPAPPQIGQFDIKPHR